MSDPQVLLVAQQVRGVRSGVGTYVRLLLEGLQESEMRLAVATWDVEVDTDSFGNVTWIPLGAPARSDPTPGSFYTLGQRVARRAQLGSYDLVHFLDAREAWRSIRTGPHGRARMLGTVHDDYAIHAPRSPWRYFGRAGDPVRRWLYYSWLRRLEKRTYSRLDHLMTNSDATGRSVQYAYGIAPEKMTTVPLTVSAHPTGVGPVGLSGQPALLFAGGNFYRKGLDVLVRAMSLLRTRLPDARLHVAGSDPLQRKIERLARRLRVEDRVIFHGRVSPSEMESFLLGTDVFVMPSRREALGLVYLESFRAKVPVIAGSSGGVAELIQDGENGLLVHPEHPASLADAILRLDQDADLRSKLIAGGLESFAARNATNLISATREVYERVLANDS